MKEILRLPQNAIDRKMIVPYPPEMHEQVLRKGYCITVKDDEEVVYT